MRSRPLTSLVLLGALGVLAALGACRATNGASGESPAEQRSTIQSERDTAFKELYAARPEARDKIARAAGTGYFSNVNLNVLLLSTENGYGVVQDKNTGKDTYMKMAGAGVGLGMGAKDYRAVIVFTDPAVMRTFVESGWDFGGQADAGAKSGDKGAAAGGAATGRSVSGMEIYQFTKTGIALQATLQGTKYWPDSKLNP
jgi:lipid-binding SYLF domain-containing protein